MRTTTPDETVIARAVERIAENPKPEKIRENTTAQPAIKTTSKTPKTTHDVAT
jgi:hypothetical protein